MRFDADVNARSLGGLPLRDGGVTAAGIWRSASPDVLDGTGWADVARAGIRRVVDLRNSAEVGAAPARPGDLQVLSTPLEDPDAPEYASLWDRNWAHPDFYAWGLEHWPGLWHAAFAAIADAPDGAVLIHCAGGRDRTGMLSAFLLELAGVDRLAVLEDYARGMRGTNEMLRRQGLSEHEANIPADRLDAILQKYGEALDEVLDRLPGLLQRSELAPVAQSAAARLMP